MPRHVLLVEPKYPTKFPPLGLMKISAYHKLLGDNVRFVKGYSKSVRFEFWDRVYITTLFTYHWQLTVSDILAYKDLLHGDTSRLFVGGIMASLMAEELWRQTGIRPIPGILNKPASLDDDNDLIVDDLIPDYELFNGTQEKYTLLDSYFGYSTRGCVNKCKFCGVPKLEPKFVEYRGLIPYVKKIEELYGEKKDLVLFDNNILASKKFKQIITDILDLGFEKGAKFQNIRLRHVDFNQGTDARLMKEWHFKLLSKICINPLRIAFDHIKLKNIYVDKVRLAAKYGIRNLSNYILYNYEDTPDDLWQRLKINIDLNQEFGLKIYSFPMKYIPVYSKDRLYVNEPNWNWHFIRSIQRILNVTKGIVMPGSEFFYRAFGESSEEFHRILHMPEGILMTRGREPGTEELEWVRKFESFTANEKAELLAVLNQNRTRAALKKAIAKTKNSKLKRLLQYYLPFDWETKSLALFRA
ncbi:MAG: cobalamin-binding domain-containing protein [Desulforudis sp.]|jgi:hypothetical protein|nr:MAG: cobalamin-binding domain-containing protein [Desulforudis sp.]